MELKKIEVSAWNNGQHHESGAGYGIYVLKKDRKFILDKNINFISIKIDGKEEFKASISNSFKRIGKIRKIMCGEIRKIEIGIWFKELNLLHWEKNNPPKFDLTHIKGNEFTLSYHH
ncbi:MAG: hypothetical protein HY951_00570 [Bacteroidia bacterium]|nr:hypothetical protein [Bacteroidia bacterium]